MKKIIIILCLFLLCGCLGSTPTKEVENYLSKYQMNKINYMDINIIDTSNYSKTQKAEYENILKNHFKNLEYTVKDEIINADKAIVTVEISVYDYSKILKKALEYKNTHINDFMIDDYYSETKYIDYKISKLKGDLEKVKYTLDIPVTKIDNKWYVDELSDEYKEKLYGIYNY